MLLRYLVPITLKKATKVKNPNGTYSNTYEVISNHNVQAQNLMDDSVSATIYGAKISKMLRLSSPLGNLEEYLLPKVENQADNISDYYIFIDNKIYKITSVSSDRIDIELVNSKTQIVSL